MNTYWGEMHTHTFCGGGTWRTIEEAAATARQHLDFWAPAEHHDHRCFDWERICRATAEANESGRFVAFPGHEVANLNGDFNVYYPSEGPPAYLGNDLHEFFDQVRSHAGIVIPHHTGYKVGCRGMQWDKFFPQDIAPLVEVFSMHGSSERDPGPYPMDLAWMGPRESGGCALTGLKAGYRFGFIASSDGHNGYPGTHGMGLLGIKAEDLSRTGIFSALRARRTWAVAGDRIDIVSFQANGRPLGADVPSGTVDVEFDIQGLDTLDTVDVITNRGLVRRFSGWESPAQESRQYACRICWGWGGGGQETHWSGTITVSHGLVRRVVPIFGPPAPDTYRVDGNTAEFSSVTSGYNADWTTNRYRCGGECGLALLIDGDASTLVAVAINGMQIRRTLGELAKGSEVILLQDAASGGKWNVPKIKLYQSIPEYRFRMQRRFAEVLQPGEFLYLRIRQDNGQMAWTSPVFAVP
jgi:hypothetical protein